MKTCIVDFESQSEDPATTNVTEVGALLRDHATVGSEIISQLVYEPHYPAQTQEIVELTGITDEMLQADGLPRLRVFEDLCMLIYQADYVFAHNKKFDETLFYATCDRVGIKPPKKQWICTVTEFDWPRKYTCKKLSHLAFEHGIQFNKDDLHRALDDVKLLSRLMNEYELEDIIGYANEPWTYVQAIFPAPFQNKAGFEQGRAKASKLGFGWEKAKGDEREFPKMWVTRRKQRHIKELEEKAEKLNLSIRII